MQFTCDRDIIADAITIVSKASGKLNPTDLLRIELLDSERIILFCNDNTIGIKTQIHINEGQVVGTNDAEGAINLPARFVLDTVKSLPPGILTFSTNEDNTRCEIRNNKAHFSLKVYTTSPEEVVDIDNGINIGSEDFAESLKAVSIAVTQNESKPTMQGVYIKPTDDGVDVMATDSYRIAFKHVSGVNNDLFGNNENGVIVPAKVASELINLVDKETDNSVEIELTTNKVICRIGDSTIAGSLIGGQFPNLYNFIKTDNLPLKAYIPREGLLDIMKRMKLLSMETQTLTIPMYMKFSNNNVKVWIVSPDVGDSDEDIEAQYSDEEVEFAFSVAYLMDAFNILDGENIIFHMKSNNDGSTNPVLITTDKEDSLIYMVIPLSI